MKKTINNIKEGNMPTTVQMKLLHWLIQLELSEGVADDSVNLTWLSTIGSSKDNQLEYKNKNSTYKN